MLKINAIEWEDFFSYGSNNKLLVKEPLTQLVGDNGVGKSSIPLILQEILFAKNFKGVKKADLVNRKLTNAKGVSGKVEFELDNDLYTFSMSRRSTLKAKLLKNGEDISANTAQGTYKALNEILNIDFDLFSSLTYQSSTNSLSFLTDTDLQRKKFLIQLFMLDKYTKAHDIYKQKVKEVQDKITQTQGSLIMLNNIIEDNKKTARIKQQEVSLVEPPRELQARIAELNLLLTDFSAKNSLIEANLKNKERLNSLSAPSQPNVQAKNYVDVLERQRYLNIEVSNLNSLLTKYKALGNSCPTCLQEVPKEKVEEEKLRIISEISEKTTEINNISAFIQEQRAIEQSWATYNAYLNSKARLESSIDYNLPDVTYTSDSIVSELKALDTQINNYRQNYKQAIQLNQKAATHNAIVDKLDVELELNLSKLTKLSSIISEAARDIDNLNLLKEALSPKGLVAHKLESLVKTLEEKINENLYYKLSDNKLSLTFNLEGDKLNVVIHNMELQADISSLSAGELSRVNVAVLLAIRALLSNISNVNINLLFLDEIMGVLDLEGKESLIELLQEQENLNIFLVSHEWSHPLVPKLMIKKNSNNIAVIENG